MIYKNILLGIALLVFTYPLFWFVVGAVRSWVTVVLWLVLLISWVVAVYSFFRPNTSYLFWVIIFGIILNASLSFYFFKGMINSMNNKNNNNQTNSSAEEMDEETLGWIEAYLKSNGLDSTSPNELFVGMRLEDARRILGEPTSNYKKDNEEWWKWYHNPEQMHVAPYIRMRADDGSTRRTGDYRVRDIRAGRG